MLSHFSISGQATPKEEVESEMGVWAVYQVLPTQTGVASGRGVRLWGNQTQGSTKAP